jgi:CCR4-NOT complex subunit CAF16
MMMLMMLHPLHPPQPRLAFLSSICLSITGTVNQSISTFLGLTLTPRKLNMTDFATPVKPVVCIKNLNFSYDKGKPNIVGLNCVIQPNSKIVLVGANGAGKSTFLRILTGQIFMNLESDEFDINGTERPNDQHNGVAYLGGQWKRRRTGFDGICPYTMDISAREMMAKWQEENLARRDELVRVLGINLDWRMHECSDGQRKKVRIMIKLLRPFQLCVIDEFAADLDIFSRTRFFDFLSAECEQRGASVSIYCDNLLLYVIYCVFILLLPI